tara:strand:- start:14121 stop:14642 length:522 start_codon:yes stop_codon:yes gene_type:complete
MKREVTVLVDDREKKALSFPSTLVFLDPSKIPTHKKQVTIRVNVEKARLDTADYLLKGDPSVGGIERKGSISEIAQNCLTTDGRRKFLDCLKRLKDNFKYPILLFEGDVHKVQSAKIHIPGPPFNPGIAVDALLRLTLEYEVPIYMMPCSTIAQRRATGEWAARLLINTALMD